MPLKRKAKRREVRAPTRRPHLNPYLDIGGLEIEAIRARLGISQVRLAELFKIDPRTMRRYVADDLPPPRALVIALRLMDRHKVKPTDLDPYFDQEGKR